LDFAASLAKPSVRNRSYFFGRLPALFRIQLLPFAYLLVEKPLPPVVARGPSSFYRSWITSSRSTLLTTELLDEWQLTHTQLNPASTTSIIELGAGINSP
jgi:hypothetical protein